jgi:hypothetical protein
LRRGQHQPIAGGAYAEQALDLRAAEYALAPPLWPWALVGLEQLDGVGDDPSAAAGEAHDALERRQGARRGLCRAALSAQRIEQLGHVVDRDRRDPPPRKRR